MRNPNIATALRYYRKLNNLSVNDISNYLKKCGITAAPKSIYAWENGTTQPSADTLMELCSYYQIENILETFGYDTDSDSPRLSYLLNQEEKAVIDAYRKNPSMHSAVKKLLEID